MTKDHGRTALIDMDNATITFHSDRKSTIAEIGISLSVGDSFEYFTGVGSSRRVRGDAYDERTGNLLALYRAVQHVAAELKKEVNKIR